MTIGERIKKRRKELGMSQEELAKKLGYKSRSSINKIELEGNQLPQTKIVQFAYALDTTPEYIMGWYQAPALPYSYRLEFRNEKDYNRSRELTGIINQLSDEDADAVLDYARFQLSKDKYKKESMEGGEVG